MYHSSLRRAAGLAIALMVTAAACGSSSDGETVDEPAAAEATTAATDQPEADPAATAEPEADPPVTDEAEAETPATDAPATDEPETDEPEAEDAPANGGGGVDATLTRDDVDCSEEGIGSSDESSFVTAHYVVGGSLGELCFGDDDPTVGKAWNELTVIVPPLQLADLGLFGGFVSGEEGAETTLAFVNSLDADGTLFQMSVNLDSYDEDANEALLTMAHEFTHVFTALPSQLDRTAESEEGCTTYYNGEGCYLPDSIMAQWIELFWGDGLLDGFDPNVEATAAVGQERCDTNAGFFGPYAASVPEEDFAESFSAFVYQLPTASPEQQAKLDWMAAQPGLAEYRDRAIAAGLGPLQNNFDACGAG